MQAAPVLTPLARVSQEHGLTSLAERLMELRHWLEDDLGTIGDAIAEVVAVAEDHCHTLGDGPRTKAAMAHLTGLAGKRIRPLCVIVAARLGGLEVTPIVRDLAIVSEIVHAATLLHDDVIDEGTERRGKPTARVLYGNTASVLAGDHLLIHALRLVEQTGHRDLMVDLLDVISRMVAAEAQQLEVRGRFEPCRQTYRDIIQGKTAVLFKWALKAGAVAAGLDRELVTSLGLCGEHLGMAFQLVDDVIDLQGESRVIGKDAMADLREGKLTWPLIVASENDPELAIEIADLAATPGDALDHRRAAEVIERVRAAGGVSATEAYAREEARKAKECLGLLPAGRARAALTAVIDAAVERVA